MVPTLKKVVRGYYEITYKKKRVEIRSKYHESYRAIMWYLVIDGEEKQDLYYYRRTALYAAVSGIDEKLF